MVTIGFTPEMIDAGRKAVKQGLDDIMKAYLANQLTNPIELEQMYIEVASKVFTDMNQVQATQAEKAT